MTNTKKQALEEGMFYEQVFGPTQVAIIVDPENPRMKKITLTDENGESVSLTTPHAIRRFYEFFYKKAGLKYAKFTAMEPDMAAEIINDILKLKDYTVHFLIDDEGVVQGMSSRLHKQVSWKQVKRIVNKAIVEVFGKTKPITLTPNSATYDMQLQDVATEGEPVRIFTHVDGGNNLSKGRAAVRISYRMRTDFDVESGGVKNPCHNWANVFPAYSNTWMGVPMTHLYSLEQMAGLQNVFEIHVLKTELTKEMFIEKFQALKDIAPKMQEYIQETIKTPLSRDEMRQILYSYATKKRIPKYVIDLVMESVVSETVWGFSQALSYVRTHAELKTRGDMSREELRMVDILENIAGEIYWLAPTVAAFHEKHGRGIMYEDLIGKKLPAKWVEAETPVITVKNEAPLRG